MSQLPPQVAPGLVLSILRYWRSSLLIVVVAAGAAYGVSLLLPEAYTATARIVLTDPQRAAPFQEGGNLPDDLENYTSRQAPLLQSGSVLRRAAELVGADDVRGDVVGADGTPGELFVRATAPSPGAAVDLSAAVVQAYGELVRESALRDLEDEIGAIERQRLDLSEAVDDAATAVEEEPGDAVLQADLQAATEALTALNLRIRELRINTDAFGDGIDLIDPAQTPRQPSQPKPVRNAAVAGLFALLCAGALAWYRADRHRAADASATPGLVLGCPRLGSVPELPAGRELAGLTDGGSVAGEAYQFVTASLQFLFKWGILLVTGGASGEGKTVSAANMAAAAARDGTRVLLVDADVREAALTRRLLAVREGPGLTDLAEGRTSLEDSTRLLSIGKDGVLPFLPAGHPSRAVGSLFRSQSMGRAMEQLREAYDLVVVDCPPLLAVADVASLAVHADGIALVIARGAPLVQLEEVRSRLELLPPALVGYIFTRDEAQPAYGAPESDADAPARWRSRSGRREAEAEARLARTAVGHAATNGDGGGHPAPAVGQAPEQR